MTLGGIGDQLCICMSTSKTLCDILSCMTLLCKYAVA